jgi:hypothetical protein
MSMAIENWIDDLVDVMGSVKGHHGKAVRAYYVYKKAEFPDAIAAYPCVLTFTDAVQPSYSVGGPLIDAWVGLCEFHLFPDVSRAHYPEIMLYFARIRNAMAGSMTLGGKVAHFLPRADVPYPLRGPVRLQYGEEQEHLGIVMQWQVKENVSADFTPAA